jgi:hypothetical protein
MGWLFGWNTRKELIEHLTNGNGVVTHKHCLVGNNCWAVQEGTQDGKSVLFIVLYLMRGRDVWNKRTGNYQDSGHGWGYKGLDETAGPTEVSCPASYLEMVPDPKIGYSTEWRKRVLERAERGRRQLKPGQKIKLYGKDYEVLDKRPNRMGYTISNGYNRYRLKTSQVKNVEVLV